MYTVPDSIKDSTVQMNRIYHKGQKVIYRGQEANIVEIKPVLIIRIKGKGHVVCGNLLRDVIPCKG
jgi:hypothetical protein